ncbi:MAG: sensor histidine kinase, partial [Anaerolineales bacterium]
IIEKSLILLESEFALLMIDNRVTGESELFLSVGDYNKPTNLSVDQIWQKSFDTGEGIIFSETSGYLNSTLGISSAVIAPLLIKDSSLYGVIIVGNNRQTIYKQYQLEALQTITLLVEMFIRTINIQVDLEFQAMMAERTRLAREIHDGLAQTLGFLKMQTTQMQNYLVKGEIFSLQSSLENYHRILTEVYREIRQTIDGLRLTPSEFGFSSWLQQTVEDFSDNFGLNVELIDIDCIEGLAQEVQAQLIRIFQEALSNVRKHAKTNNVWISCFKNGEDLIIEVRDNGIGFTPDEIPAPSRYGLQIMQERSDLINAEFQVISKPMDGAIVRLRLPLGVEIKTT